MDIARILLLLRLSAAICLGGLIWNMYLLWCFKREKCRSVTVARLTDIKSKQNVRARKRGVSGPIVTVPHSSTGTYVYTVSGRDYRLKGWAHVPPGKLPKQPRVVHLTRFPSHAYLDCELMTLPEILRAFMWLMLGLCLWMLADATAAGLIIW